MKVLDLFSGIGGFSLGLERAGMETVAFCEIEEYPRKVLKKHWPDVPIYEDIRTLTGAQLEKDGISIDLICGGYPCQPFSNAGKRRGKEDDRHLWPEYLRLIRELRPRWVIGENVAGHISMGLDEVLSDLEGEDYTPRTFNIPACGVDAQHRRERVWIIAHSMRTGRRIQQKHTNKQDQADTNHDGEKESLAHPESERRGEAGEYSKRSEERVAFSGEVLADTNIYYVQGKQPSGDDQENGSILGERQARLRSRAGNWLPEPSVGRVADGIPNRAHRLRALGNAVIPQITEIIGRAIMEIER